MFVSVTVICVVLGLVVPPAEQRKRAVATLKALPPHGVYGGVRIFYDFESPRMEDISESRDLPMNTTPPGPAWLSEHIGVDYYANVVGVVLRVKNIRAEEFRLIRHFSHLELLEVKSEEGFVGNLAEPFENLSNLKHLVLRCRLTELPPEIGKLTKLTKLDLYGNQLAKLSIGDWKS